MYNFNKYSCNKMTVQNQSLQIKLYVLKKKSRIGTSVQNQNVYRLSRQSLKSQGLVLSDQ